jgi:hypothetical protein
MNASAQRSPQKKGGCGCNGGSAVPHKCSCEKPGCEACETRGFVRPRFFAGQLLTEDDLQALGQYVVGKDRLHNRHLFGDGVVCGLGVTQHPCGEGRVIVHPGYALDCCGNDIVVPCAKELDINAMVRELQLTTLGGFDCGDPCEEKRAERQKRGRGKGALARPAAAIAAGQPGAAPAEPKPKPADSPVREYCLYVRYCETDTDPVSPYATGDPCGTRTCETTRVQEGFRFELRCRPKEQPPDDILSRLCECFGDDPRWIKATNTFGFQQRYAAQLEAGARALEVGAPVADADQLKVHVAELQGLLAKRQPTPEWARANLDELLEKTRQVEAHVARSFVHGSKRATKSASDALDNARAALEDESIRAALAEKSELEREYAGAVLLNIDRLSRPDEFTPDSREHVLLAAGMVGSQALHRKVGNSVAALRDDLVHQVATRSAADALTVERRLSAPAAEAVAVAERPFSDVDAINAYAKTMKTVRSIYPQALVECICSHLNPPCQTCTDLAVLIACVEVQDCEVTKICTLDRKFVLNFVSMRYWFPFIGALGRSFHDLCCPPPDCDDDDDRLEWYSGTRISSLVRYLFPLYYAMLIDRCFRDRYTKGLTSNASSFQIFPNMLQFAASPGEAAAQYSAPLAAFASLVSRPAPAIEPDLSRQLDELRQTVNTLRQKVEGP